MWKFGSAYTVGVGLETEVLAHTSLVLMLHVLRLIATPCLCLIPSDAFEQSLHQSDIISIFIIPSKCFFLVSTSVQILYCLMKVYYLFSYAKSPVCYRNIYIGWIEPTSIKI